MKKFYIHTMGCKSNQFEGAIIKENLLKNGFTETNRIEDADIYVLNSCTVTHKSDNEAFFLLRNAKHKNPEILTVLTGCLAQTEKENLLKNDFVDMVLGNNEKLNISIYLTNYIVKDAHAADIMDCEKFNKVVLTDMTKTRVSLKIQDGCDNRCSYCIIPFARGKSRSADIDFIIEQINNFSNRGFKEVVLTGIHIGQWGKDFKTELFDLIREIESGTVIPRYRLGSLNPLEITNEMLDFLSKSEKFCPHFHLSLQSACDKTLRAMNRFYKVDEYLLLIEKINKMFNLPFIGSDIITGFAGETIEDFETTRKNLEKSGLTKIHTFPYSLRKGTAAAQSELQVDDKEKERRAAIIKAVSSHKYRDFIKKNIGTTQEILIEKLPDKKTRYLKGVTRNYLKVITDSRDETLTNSLQQVMITHTADGKIYGKIQKCRKNNFY